MNLNHLWAFIAYLFLSLLHHYQTTLSPYAEYNTLCFYRIKLPVYDLKEDAG